MTDKVQKIKEWISKEQDGLMDAQCNFEYPEHEGAYHILCNLDTYIDSLQEEPVSDDFEMALTEMIDKAQKCVVEPWAIAEQWKDYLIELAKSEEPVSEEWIKELRTKLDSMSKEDFKKVFDKYAVDFKEEPASEELEKIVEEITEPTVLNAYGTKELARRLRNTVIYGTSVSNELDEVAELYTLDDSVKPWRNLTKEAFKAGANWQKLQDMGITNNRAQDVVANVLSSADNPLDAYATEVAFMMIPATLKESYHQTNRDRIGDAVKLGAKWQEEKDNEEKVLTYKHGFEDCKEQIMKNLWKPADGDDLPDINREVIALLDNGKVVFAHRPYKGKYVGKNLTTGNIETFENETYGKGGWNIPNAKYWLDVELPKEIER